MAAKRVAVIVLNWNGFDDTARCVRSVLRSGYPGVVPVVVDNASPDGSGERLAAAFPGVEVLRAERNLGYAGGNNLGLRRALELGAEYLFVVNNDTEVPPDCIGALVEAMESDPRIGQAGPKVHDATTGRIGCVGGEIRWADAEPRQIGCGEPDAGQYTAVAEVGYVPGTAVMVGRAALEQAGPMPEQYFLYFEDTAWSLRFRAAGWKTVVVPGASITHWESSSTGKDSPMKLYYYVRNNLYFIRDYVPPDGRAGVYARFGYKLLKMAARRALRREAGHLRALRLGFHDFRRGRTGPHTHAFAGGRR